MVLFVLYKEPQRAQVMVGEGEGVSLLRAQEVPGEKVCNLASSRGNPP